MSSAPKLLAAESVAGNLVEVDSVFALLAAHRRVRFPEAMFADLSRRGRGRPSVPADVAAAILVPQALHGLSDRETMAAVRTDLRWKVACGLPVGHSGFDASPATYRRWRLAGSDRPDRIFAARRRGRHPGHGHPLIAVIRQVGREVPGAEVVIAGRCTARDYTDPGNPQIDWDDQQARAVLIDGLVRDALALLEVVSGWELDAAAAQTVAHRPQGRPRPGDQRGRSRGPAGPQDCCPPPGRVRGAPGGRARHRHRHRRWSMVDGRWSMVDGRWSMVERSIAWLVARDNRTLRYRGVVRNSAWLHARTAALNLRRLLTLGLTHRDGTSEPPRVVRGGSSRSSGVS